MAEIAEDAKVMMHLVSVCISEDDRSRSWEKCSLIVFSFEYLAVRLRHTELESIEMWKSITFIVRLMH
jgi:uncharacterized membrane protein